MSDPWFYTDGNTPRRDATRLIVLNKILGAILDGGGGGGGSSAPDSINYPGPPVTNPPALQNIVVDSNGVQYQYWGGAWH